MKTLSINEQEHLQKRHARLIEATLKMRHYQIAFFRDHSSMDLKAAKKYEKQVDDLLKEERTIEQQQQSSLF